MGTGLSFSPANQDQTQQPGTGAKPNPVQDAIQLLSFRLPSWLGAAAPAAPGLMGGRGGASPSDLGSNIGGGVVEAWLRRFFGGQAGPTAAPIPGGQGPFTRAPGTLFDFGHPAPSPTPGPRIGLPTPVGPSPAPAVSAPPNQLYTGGSPTFNERGPSVGGPL